MKETGQKFLFVKVYVNKSTEFWINLLFISDESKFDEKKTVLRKPNTSFETKNFRPTGRAYRWTCYDLGIHVFMFFCGVSEMMFIECNMNVKQYVNIVLDNLFNSALKLGIGDSNYFQYYNNPKPMANVTRI